MSAKWFIALAMSTATLFACGPSPGEPALDPEEVFTAFCANLFACPDATDAIGAYGSQERCEDVHRMNHDLRDAECRSRVLALEDCLASLACEELRDYIHASGSSCDEERLHLLEDCTPL
jgi:hypothetical protein